MHPMLLDISSKLETERLVMKPYEFGDGEWLHVVFQENREHLAIAIEGVYDNLGLDMTTQDDAEIFVRRLSAGWAARQRFVFGLWEKVTERYIGEIWIESREWEISSHEIGYYLTEEYLGMGFATEATKAGIQFIFEDLKANKVRLACDADNGPSSRVAERCGFTREGCLRDEVKRRDGSFVHKLIYGMLKTEFETRT